MTEPLCPDCLGDPVQVIVCPRCIPVPLPGEPKSSGLVAALASELQRRRQLTQTVTAEAQEIITAADDVARSNLQLRSRLEKAEAERDAARQECEVLRAQLHLLRRRR